MLTLTPTTITVDTATQTAVFTAGFLTSLTNKLTGATHIAAPATGSPLQLVYPGHGTVDVLGNLAATVSVHPVSPTSAQFRFAGWDADGILTVSEDPATGEVLVEPAAYSSRSGVLSCRWRLPGVSSDLELVAPFFQGVKLPLGDPLLERRWAWPMFWEAGLAILQGRDGGCWVHCRDTHYRYKALNISGGELGFETESYGPTAGNLGAGGLVWRLNCYAGDWTVPASAYRDWLFHAYHLADQQRPAWLHELRLAVSWYNGDPALLDALATRVDPRTVLLHYSQWRTDAYDENYPTFTPSEQAKATIAKARAMGFHIQPHCNSVDMDPSHPAYAWLRDFQYRDVNNQRVHGWGWDKDFGILGPPNSNHSLAGNRQRKVMIKVHPGLSMWRSLLCEELGRAVEQAPVDGVFIDVTLCSGNLDNCLVEGTTSSEGMNRLIRQVQGVAGGLAVGGEGLNEITFQGLSVAQAHLFNSWHATADGLERCGGCALNEFLFGRLCRTFGYSGLAGKDDAQALRMRIHAEHGAIPTLTVSSAEEILTPNAYVAAELARATA